MNLKLSVLFIFLFLLGAGPSADRPYVKIGPHVFFVEVARTPQQWQKGLMFRTKMAPNEGLLFFGKRAKHQSFWMKNTPLSLDIIFIGKNNRIVHIAENTTPFSLKKIPSKKRALHILEVLAGRAKALQLNAGDLVKIHIK